MRADGIDCRRLYTSYYICRFDHRPFHDNREHHGQRPMRRRPEDSNVDNDVDEGEDIESLLSWKQWWK
jgi:hypothetical protein